MLESLKTIVKTNSDKKLFDGDLQVSYGEFYNLVRLFVNLTLLIMK